MDQPLTVLAALTTGLVTSVHCVAMCGPLACSVSQANSGEGSQLISQSLYHISRVISYGMIGALCGALGQQPLKWIFDTPAVLFPWLLTALFFITALGLWKKLPHPKWLTYGVAKARFFSLKISARKGAFAMGALTPLLPCGPLYIMFAVTLVSGSALRGSEFAIAFALGTVPLLWVAQHSLSRLKTLIPEIRFSQLQRGISMLAAILMVWRLHDTLPSLSPKPHPQQAAETYETELPSCCP